MTIFKELAERNIKCEICGAETIALYGCGWENDIIYCSDRECSAEYVFPTSSEAYKYKRSRKLKQLADKNL